MVIIVLSKLRAVSSQAGNNGTNTTESSVTAVVVAGDTATGAEATTAVSSVPTLKVADTTQSPDSSDPTFTRSGKNVRPSPSPSSKPGSSSSPRMWELLQQLGAALPQLRDAIVRGQRPTPQQVKLLMDLVRQVGASLSALPNTLSDGNSTFDLAKVLSSSGLLRNLTASLYPSRTGSSHATGVPPDSQPYTVHWLQCQADLLYLSNGLVNGQMWAMQMVDSWGKPESSILKGNLLFMGNNDECRDVHYTNTSTSANVQGNTCRLRFYLDFLKGATFVRRHGMSLINLNFNKSRDRFASES
ncbi:hypothetical protein PoB_005673300 [Plakobranchus ocellatus]|uniref:Nose resistant-to-fluoxetine protein N-terminal domain-containing protein n=1 Tax=Plakobranchus ocellatus TaxID=259542 RepID=A0AAV4CFF0_9GAST|nr:hypothetical protein PoB_005673300 [Plakobranchus ocellatus]